MNFKGSELNPFRIAQNLIATKLKTLRKHARFDS
jgi:hypothetical protein